MKLWNSSYNQIRAAGKIDKLVGALMLLFLAVAFCLSKEPASAMISAYWLYSLINEET